MSWECPDCKFDNHELRSKCRNCKAPRDDKSKEPKELGEKGMAKFTLKDVKVLDVEPGVNVYTAARELIDLAKRHGFAEMTFCGTRIETDGSEAEGE